MIELFWSKYW